MEPTSARPLFRSAIPVWIAGRAAEKNLFAGFRGVFTLGDADAPAVLRVTASSFYRAWLNGRFLGHGPARAAHGFFRVDEWDLAEHCKSGPNVLALEVAGYNVNGYALLDQPAFVQAEVVSGARVLAATGAQGAAFQALLLPQRVQKIQRYSFQRSFVEVYRLADEDQRWRDDPEAAVQPCACEPAQAGDLLPRGVPCPDFAMLRPVSCCAAGKAELGALPEKPWRDRSLSRVGPNFKGYTEAELEEHLSDDIQRFRFQRDPRPSSPAAPTGADLAAGSWTILDFTANRTGFIGLEATCDRPATLYLMFDETLTAGDVNPLRLGAVSAAGYHLQPGRHRIETFEPYTLRYLKLLAQGGPVSVREVFLRELACPDADRAQFCCSDTDMTDIFEAARQTFRQNSLDIFMDCPSRERAGWLCDSFFTARVEPLLTGASRIERNFLENFLLAPRRPELPEGMFPMCYPADQRDGNFIPNWALWLVLELEEYVERSADRALAAAFEPRVTALLDYFRRFRNRDGLLERLEKWVFVEWSRANEFVQDVNYPTNMLYSAALRAAARLYKRDELSREADRIAAVVRAQSYDGEFFVDNAVRQEGRLAPTRNRTEACQYYAFCFGIASPQTHPELCRKLVEEFGPLRRPGAHPDIHPANLLMGHFLRFDLLSGLGQRRRIARELKALFLPMAQLTGTLWEHDSPRASLNHGFASHAAHVLARDVLGVSLDRAAKSIRLNLDDVGPAWCRAGLPIGNNLVHISWRRKEAGWACQVTDLPAGYSFDVRQPAGERLE